MRISGVSPGGEEGRAGRACEESSLLGQGHGKEEEAGRRNSAEPLSSLLGGLLSLDTTRGKVLASGDWRLQILSALRSLVRLVLLEGGRVCPRRSRVKFQVCSKKGRHGCHPGSFIHSAL